MEGNVVVEFKDKWFKVWNAFLGRFLDNDELKEINRFGEEVR